MSASLTQRQRITPLDDFLAFVAEMDRQRAQVEKRRPAPARAALDVAEGVAAPADFPTFLLDTPIPVAEQDAAAARHVAAAPTIDPEVILERLQAYLEGAGRTLSGFMSDVMLAQYREIQYAMVALADDAFLHEVDWDGREAWRLNHLEQRLFRSRLAGDRIFDRMDALLASGDRRLVQLASVYLCMLSLGFKGRYRSPGGEAHIRGYAERLFLMISGREPALLQAWSGGTVQPIMPSAYAHTVRGNPTGRIRRQARWGLILGGILLAWIVIGQALWLTSSAGLDDAAQSVLRAAGETQ